MKKKGIRKALKKLICFYLPLLLFLGFILIAIYWMVITSLKEGKEVLTIPATYWPRKIVFSNYLKLFSKSGFGRYFLNTIVIAVSVTFIVTFLSLIGGFAMSRYQFKGKTTVYIMLLLTQMFPAVVLMIPLFRMMTAMSLINNPLSVIIVSSATSLPFCMFTMMGFYNAIPTTLEEAAQVDGCTVIGSVFRVLLPNMRSSMVAVGAYAFINGWNQFLYSVAFISQKEKYTLPLILNSFQTEFGIDYGGLAAGCVIALAPVIILFVFIQKNLVGDQTSGSVKG